MTATTKPTSRTRPPRVPLHSYMIGVARIGEPQPAPKMDQPELAVDYWKEVVAHQGWYDDNKEHLVVLHLNTRYRITAYSLIAIGSLNESIAHPREIFRPVIVAGAYAFIVMHNHPSGEPSPSQNDHSLTRRLREGAELLQIKMLDHLIVGQPSEGRKEYFSFKEAGVL